MLRVHHQGFGRFAAFNVLQLLGHHESFPFDTETTRLFREEKGVAKSVPSAKVRILLAPACIGWTCMWCSLVEDELPWSNMPIACLLLL